ncbi:RNA-directed DNA polymerase, eukaryota, reverse transcriptase zinc-binding domain protein, partial [Tanacetum coccineum]
MGAQKEKHVQGFFFRKKTIEDPDKGTSPVTSPIKEVNSLKEKAGEEEKSPNNKLEENHESEDVFADMSRIGKSMENDIIEGIDRGAKEVRNLIKDENLSMCAVIETRIKAQKLQKIGDAVFKSWSWIENMKYCDKGCRIMGSLYLFCTIVYAANGGMERIDLWKELKLHKGVVGKDAWIIMGDMNVTLDPSEHSAGGSTMTKDMNEFKECVNEIEIEDKLDRAMGNENLISKYPQSHAVFLPYLISDHCPVVLAIPNSLQAKKKAFRFANFITNKKEFKEEVAKHWRSCTNRCKMFRVVKDLKTLKNPLKALAWKNGDIFENVKDLRDKLKEVQTRIDEDPSNKRLRVEESTILMKYNSATKDEELLLFQKAKIKWLSVRDRNNEFFHRMVKNRNHRNRINAIHDEDGRRYEGDKVAEQFVKHFQNFLGNSIPVEKIVGMEDLFKNKLETEEAEYMVRDVSNEEIKHAIFQIEDNKAPGPDGYSSYFYKKSWDIIGEDICSAVKEFFSTGKMLSEINYTNIALVPKIKTPAKVSDYRPIACCNVIFKCISKVITERIKNCLGKLVNQNQDNILISQELLKGYNRKDGPKRVALKIDLQKAYDTVNWVFLEDILKGFGFHEKMVAWIMKCVTTTSFSIIVNGESKGYFKGGRGLRQGDPISPYLFTLIMEVLNLLLIRKIGRCNSFQYHFGCSKLKITHVCFADDLLMFSHGDKQSVELLKNVIEEFGRVYGLLLNYNKSTIIFGSVKEEDRKEILDIMPFKVEKLPVRYLGVPLITKRIGVKECKSLTDKVKSKILKKNKCLSYAGRLQLVASVLESIHVYWATVFLLPQAIIDEINSLLKGFLWN